MKVSKKPRGGEEGRRLLNIIINHWYNYLPELQHKNINAYLFST